MPPATGPLPVGHGIEAATLTAETEGPSTTMKTLQTRHDPHSHGAQHNPPAPPSPSDPPPPPSPSPSQPHPRGAQHGSTHPYGAQHHDEDAPSRDEPREVCPPREGPQVARRAQPVQPRVGHTTQHGAGGQHLRQRGLRPPGRGG